MSDCTEAQFLAWKSESRRALETLDIEYAKRILPNPLDESVWPMMLHKARLERTDISDDLRRESLQWLRERGLRRVDGTPLPEDIDL